MKSGGDGLEGLGWFFLGSTSDRARQCRAGCASFPSDFERLAVAGLHVMLVIDSLARCSLKCSGHSWRWTAVKVHVVWYVGRLTALLYISTDRPFFVSHAAS